MFVPPASLELGPISVKLYSLCILIAVAGGYLLAKKRACLYKISQEQIEKLLPYPIVGGIIGARLYHVLDEWGYYKDHLLEIFAIWQGGIAIYGCIIGGIVGVYFFAKRHKQQVLSLLDLLAPSMLLGQAIGRWGNYFNQEAYGPPTNLPWKIYIAPENRLPQWQEHEYFQPLFLYESLLNLAGFFLLIYIAPKYTRRPGTITGAYLVTYSVIRLFLEQLRYDTAVFADIKVAALVSGVFIVLGVYLLAKVAKTAKNST